MKRVLVFLGFALALLLIAYRYFDISDSKLVDTEGQNVSNEPVQREIEQVLENSLIDKRNNKPKSTLGKKLTQNNLLTKEVDDEMMQEGINQSTHSNSGKKFVIVDGQSVEVVPIELELSSEEQTKLEQAIHQLEDAIAENQEYAHFIEDKLEKIKEPTLDSTTEQAIANLYQEDRDDNWATKMESEIIQYTQRNPITDITLHRAYCRSTRCELYLRYTHPTGKADFLVAVEQSNYFISVLKAQDFYKLNFEESGVHFVQMEDDNSFAQIYLHFARKK